MATPGVAAEAEETNSFQYATAGQLLTEIGSSVLLSVARLQQFLTEGPPSLLRRRLFGQEFSELSARWLSKLKRSQRQRSRSLHMILAVFLAFALTYLPFTITNLADRRAVLDRTVYMLTSLAFWAGCSVNPIIYGILNTQFRRAYATTVINCWRRVRDIMFA